MADIIEITKEHPFLVKEAKVAKISVEQIKFADFVDCTVKANVRSSSPGQGDAYRKFLLREQRKIQCKALDAKGKVIATGEGDWLNMPRIYAKPMNDLLNGKTDAPGEVIVEGDGVGTPVLYRLGTPLSTGSGVTIEELEFSAKTLGDLEDVISETNRLRQALLLVQKCAKPVGQDVTLIALPSWAVDELSFYDGVIIMEKVLPRFLEEQKTS